MDEFKKERTEINMGILYDIQKQAEQFTLENRMVQCTEEMAELTQAFCKYQRIKSKDKTCKTKEPTVMYSITEEIADVEICLEQIKYLLGDEKQNQIEQIKQEKYKRTERRLVQE